MFFVVVTGGGRVAVCVSVANVGGVIVLVLSAEVVHSTRAVSLKCLDRKRYAYIGVDGSNSGASRF